MYYEEDLDMYGVPYIDGDPLTGLVITIVLIVLWYVIAWIYYKLIDIWNEKK
jgi:hypothetical protein